MWPTAPQLLGSPRAASSRNQWSGPLSAPGGVGILGAGQGGAGGRAQATALPLPYLPCSLGTLTPEGLSLRLPGQLGRVSQEGAPESAAVGVGWLRGSVGAPGQSVPGARSWGTHFRGCTWRWSHTRGWDLGSGPSFATNLGGEEVGPCWRDRGSKVTSEGRDDPGGGSWRLGCPRAGEGCGSELSGGAVLFYQVEGLSHLEGAGHSWWRIEIL